MFPINVLGRLSRANIANDAVQNETNEDAKKDKMATYEKYKVSCCFLLS